MNPQIFGKKSVKKNSGSFFLQTLHPEGRKVTLHPEGRKVTLPPSNKGEQEIFRDVKGCNRIQNGIIIIYTLISGFSRENRKLSGKFTFPRGFETLFGPISSRA